jgi:hypothetical protein
MPTPLSSVRIADAVAAARNNAIEPYPAWMRSDKLTANDWQVITEYMEVLKPLKYATTSEVVVSRVVLAQYMSLSLFLSSY